VLHTHECSDLKKGSGDNDDESVYIKSCNLDSMIGEEFYAVQESISDAGIIFCYHIKIGSEEVLGHIKQDISEYSRDESKFDNAENCNAKNFIPDLTVGKKLERVSESKHEYIGGDAKYCPNGKQRRASLMVVLDKSARGGATSSAHEPSTCNYDVTVVLQSCTYNRHNDRLETAIH